MAEPTTSRPAQDGSAQAAPVGPRVYLVATGGVLAVLEVPFVGPITRLFGIVLVVLGVVLLRQLAIQPVARQWLGAAVATAVVVLVAQLAATIAGQTVGTATVAEAPGWARWLALTPMTLGVAGTLMLVVGMARELHHHGDDEAEDTWWYVAIAVVLTQTPIVVAAVLAQVTGRPEGVQGTAALLLFIAAIAPYGLLARAGHHSPTLDVR